MAFPCGLFLMYVGEEEAFWMMHSLLQHKHKLHGLYAPDLWQTRQCVHQLEMLIKAHLPKLHKHMTDAMGNQRCAPRPAVCCPALPCAALRCVLLRSSGAGAGAGAVAVW
jgi:hypothetical protein